MPVRSRTVWIRMAFESVDGTPLVYEATKQLALFGFLRRITTFRGEIRAQDGRLVATAIARFDLRDVPKLLGSMRFVRPWRPVLVKGVKESPGPEGDLLLRPGKY
jgi:hypothetical protein